MTDNGLFHQSAAEIRADLTGFYFGDTAPWIGGIRVNHEQNLELIMADPDGDGDDDGTAWHTDTRLYTATATDIKTAFNDVNMRYPHALCCRTAIIEEALGAGCATDLDVIVQMATYHELVFG